MGVWRVWFVFLDCLRVVASDVSVGVFVFLRVSVVCWCLECFLL